MTRGARDADTGAIALGFRIKSGRAIAVVLTGAPEAPALVLRRDVTLCDEREPATRQPYHDGFGTAQSDEREIARLGAIVERRARVSIDALLRADAVANRPCRGAVLVVGSVIDPLTIANPHIRAHAHEGRLFRTVVERVLEQRGVATSTVVQKALSESAARSLRRPPAAIARIAAAFGKAAGGPWRADEKAAATAAWIALAG